MHLSHSQAYPIKHYLSFLVGVDVMAQPIHSVNHFEARILCQQQTIEMTSIPNYTQGWNAHQKGHMIEVIT